MQIKHTMCRLCSEVCPIIVHLEDNKLVSAERKDGPAKEKDYFCPKLKFAEEIIYSPKRLKSPLLREGSKEKISWKEATWDQALDIIAAKLNFFKTEYGAESVGWLRGQAPDWGAPWDYAIRLMNAFGSPNTIGSGSICHEARNLPHVMTYGKMTNPDFQNSKCMIVWGKNPRDTSPVQYDGILSAKERGSKLIVVDPIKTKLASLADIWLHIKPGGDGLLAMAMMNVIISEALYDPEFVREWTVGFDKLREEVGKYPPEKVAGKIWLEPEQIQAAARLYSQTKPACIGDGNGLDMYLNTSQNTRAVCCLRALTGNLDKKGGDLIPEEVPFRYTQLWERYRKDIKPISFEYPLYNKFSKTVGDQTLAPLIDAILEEKPYPLKALIIQGANPVVSTIANSKRTIQALRKLEFIVVIDLFPTQTAQFADIVLPPTTSFEKTQLNLVSLAQHRVMLQDKVIDWVGNSWPDWKIIFELAKRMGYEKEFPWNTVEEAIDYQLEPAGITVEMLRKNPDGIVFKPKSYEKYKQKGFDTRSGKIEFFSEVLQQYGYSPVPNFKEGDENLISFFDRKDDFPLIGISGARSNNFVHSQFRNIPSLLKREPEPFVDIYPKDAEARGISNGDNVRIETPSGGISMKARISDVVQPGSIRIAYGWGEYNTDFRVNTLTEDKNRDPIASTTSNRCFMCNIFKVVR